MDLVQNSLVEKNYLKDLKADILIYRFRIDIINIEQSVKQCDALSHSLIILCMDPLRRRVNEDKYKA